MPPIGSPGEWEAARPELLVKEKELTRVRVVSRAPQLDIQRACRPGWLGTARRRSTALSTVDILGKVLDANIWPVTSSTIVAWFVLGVLMWRASVRLNSSETATA